MTPKLKWWFLCVVMLGLVLMPALSFAQVFGNQHSEQAIGEESETSLQIEFTTVFPVPEQFHEPIAEALERERVLLPDVDEWTVSAFRNIREWAHVVLVPTAVVSSGWKMELADEEIIQVVAHLENESWVAYLIDSPTFSSLKGDVPRHFIDFSESEMASSNALLFPWTSGQLWRKTQGWHLTNAIDFAPVTQSNPPVHFAVLAAADGNLTQVCNDGYQSALRAREALDSLKQGSSFPP
jgi:hypothetical protein